MGDFTYDFLTTSPADTRPRGLGANDIRYHMAAIQETFKKQRWGSSYYVQSITHDGSAISFDFDNYNIFNITLEANMEVGDWSFSNIPASPFMGWGMWIFDQDSTGGWTIALPTSFEFPYDITQEISTVANTRTVYQAFTIDGGTKWIATLIGTDYSTT